MFLIGSALFFAAINYAFEKLLENEKEASFENPLQCLLLPERDEEEEFAQSELIKDNNNQQQISSFVKCGVDSPKSLEILMSSMESPETVGLV